MENWIFFEMYKDKYIETCRQLGVTSLMGQWEHIAHITAVVIRPSHTQMCAMACGAQREMKARWMVVRYATKSASL